MNNLLKNGDLYKIGREAYYKAEVDTIAIEIYSSTFIDSIFFVKDRNERTGIMSVISIEGQEFVIGNVSLIEFWRLKNPPSTPTRPRGGSIGSYFYWTYLVGGIKSRYFTNEIGLFTDIDWTEFFEFSENGNYYLNLIKKRLGTIQGIKKSVVARSLINQKGAVQFQALKKLSSIKALEGTNSLNYMLRARRAYYLGKDQKYGEMIKREAQDYTIKKTTKLAINTAKKSKDVKQLMKTMKRMRKLAKLIKLAKVASRLLIL